MCVRLSVVRIGYMYICCSIDYMFLGRFQLFLKRRYFMCFRIRCWKKFIIINDLIILYLFEQKYFFIFVFSLYMSKRKIKENNYWGFGLGSIIIMFRKKDNLVILWIECIFFRLLLQFVKRLLGNNWNILVSCLYFCI